MPEVHYYICTFLSFEFVFNHFISFLNDDGGHDGDNEEALECLCCTLSHILSYPAGACLFHGAPSLVIDLIHENYYFYSSSSYYSTVRYLNYYPSY